MIVNYFTKHYIVDKITVYQKKAIKRVFHGKSSKNIIDHEV